MARVVYNTPELTHLLQSPAGPVGRDILRRSGNVRARAEQLADARLNRSTRKGTHYHDSFVHTLEQSPLVGIVENTAPHAMPLEVGSIPHIIRAKNAPYLRFYSPKIGRWVRIKEVNHPGNDPYHVVLDAFAAAAV